jgi:hypothetical protein
LNACHLGHWNCHAAGTGSFISGEVKAGLVTFAAGQADESLAGLAN